MLRLHAVISEVYDARDVFPGTCTLLLVKQFEPKHQFIHHLKS